MAAGMRTRAGMSGVGHVAGAGPDRRLFLGVALSALGGGLLLGVTGLTACSRRRRGRGLEVEDAGFVAGPVDRFAEGTVTAFEEAGFFLVRLEGGGFLALSRDCTHVGCPVTWDVRRKMFRCPCHASLFDIRGEVLRPPALRPLDLLPVRIEGKVITVDLAERVRRDTFEPGQVTFA